MRNFQCLRTLVAELNPLENPILGQRDNAFRSVEQLKPLKAMSAALSGWAQPFPQFRPASSARDILDGDRHGLLLAEQDDEPLAAGDAGLEQVALQHHIVLRRDRNDDSGIFGPLRFMDGRCVSEDHLVEFAECVGYWAPIESDSRRARDRWPRCSRCRHYRPPCHSRSRSA